MNTPRELRAELLSRFARGAEHRWTDADFDALAQRAFQHQFENNTVYRAYCTRRGITPASVTAIDDIPAVPTAAFKELPLVTGDPAGAQIVFRTSGTTRGREQRGAHHILDLAIYHESLAPAFESFVLGGRAPMQTLVLVPPPAQVPDSSLSHMAGVVLERFGAPDSGYYVSVAGGLDYEALDARLDAAQTRGVPVLIFATSLSMLHLLEHARAHGRRFALPAGSTIMDTGGFKGVRREVNAAHLRAEYAEIFGVHSHFIVNEYGMTEMCSQMYDGHLRAALRGHQTIVGCKQGPPWLRTTVVDPETLRPIPHGRTGLLRHFDLANLDSVCALQTEDVGVAVSDGFMLHGRAPGASPRGCSIALDMLLSRRDEE